MSKLLKNLLVLMFVSVSLAVTVHAEPVIGKPVGSDTLDFWVMDNGLGSQKSIHKILKKFQRETGTPVRLRVLSWGEAFAEISRALSDTAAAPDLLQLGSTWVPHFAAAGQIRALDSMLAQMDSSRFYAQAYRSASIVDKPEIYAFPWFLDVRALFVNEWLWHSLGIQESDIEDFPKFLGALREINRGGLKNTEMKPVAAFSLPGKDDWTGPQMMAPFIWNQGGDFIVKDGAKYRSALLDTNTLKGIAIYAKILGDSELAPFGLQDNSERSASRFVNSEQLVHYSTSELIRQLEYPASAGGLRSSAIADDGIMIVPFPAGPQGRATFVGGSHLTLPSNADSTKFKAAQSLLAYLLRVDNLDAFCRSVGFPPSDRGLMRIWMQDRRYQQLINDLDSGRSFPNIPEWGSIENLLIALSNSMGKLFAGEADSAARVRGVAGLLLDADRQIDSVLGNTPKDGDAALRPWVESLIAEDIAEVAPEGLSFEPQEPPFPVWRVVLVGGCVLVVGVLGLLAWLLVKLIRGRKSRGGSIR